MSPISLNSQMIEVIEKMKICLISSYPFNYYYLNLSIHKIGILSFQSNSRSPYLVLRTNSINGVVLSLNI